MAVMSRPILPLVALMLLSSLQVADAALVRIDFTGTNSSPAAANVWGVPVPQVRGYLVYDDATAASSTTGAFSTNYAGAIKEFSFSLGEGGSSVFSGLLTGGSFGSAQVTNAAGSDRLSFNNLLFGPAALVGEVPTLTNVAGTGIRTFNRAELTFGLAGPNTAVGSQALLGIDPLAFTGAPRNLQVFLSYTTTGVASGFPAVSYNFNFDSLRVSPVVPEPATGMLLAAGLVVVTALRRRRT